MRSLDINDDSVWSQNKYEEFLGDETPYLSAIKALVLLANSTLPDICFAVNLLARFSSSPTKRHWNGVDHILEYPRRTIVMSLFYSEESKTKLIGYADAEYLSDPHKARSQTRYLFSCGGTIISWSINKANVATQKLEPFMKQVESASGWDQWPIILRKCVVFLWKRIYQAQCTNIMLHV